MAIDWTKPLRTRYGIPVKRLHGDGSLPQRKVCEMKLPDGRDILFTVDESGRHDAFLGDGPYDVMNVEEEKPTPAAIDWTKPIQTRGGRKARVLCTDLKGACPIVVAVEYPLGDFEFTARFAADGVVSQEPDFCIVNVPPPPPPRRKHADVIIAWADGAEVEFRLNHLAPWLPTSCPSFDPALDYRVKP